MVDDIHFRTRRLYNESSSRLRYVSLRTGQIIIKASVSVGPYLTAVNATSKTRTTLLRLAVDLL